jgi:two-component system, sensor histidine kinase LadS
MNIKVIIFFAATLLMSIPAAGDIPASRRVIIDDKLIQRNISGHLEYIEDFTREVGINKVISDGSLLWKPSPGGYINFGYTDARLWFRFTAENITRRDTEWYLEVDFPPIDMIELYIRDGQGLQKKMISGDFVPFRSREVRYRTHVFRIIQKPGAITCFMSIDSRDSVNFNLNILSPGRYSDRMQEDLPIYWAYFGLMMVMALYNLMMFFSVRERVYLFYTGFIITFLLFEFNFTGFAFQYLWPESVWWTNHANPLLLSLTIFWISVFLVDFIEEKGLYPSVYKLTIAAVAVPSFLMAVISLFLDVQSALIAIIIIGIFDALFLTAIGLYLGFYIDPPSKQARMALFSFSFYVLSIPVVAFTMFGILPANFFTRWAMQLGSSTVVILFSFGLADRINSMKNIIQKAETKYRRLVENSADIIFSLDEKNSITSINSSVTHILGFKPDKLVGKNFLDLVHDTHGSARTLSRMIVDEYISNLKKYHKSFQFRTTFMTNFSHEPLELSISLEYAGENRTGYTILGKASTIIDDSLLQFLQNEHFTYSLNNFLHNADIMSQRLVRNLYRYTDHSTISRLRFALREAIINAIEHGNLNMSFEEKTACIEDGSYVNLIKERQGDPKFSDKKIIIDYTLNSERVVYMITDSGKGFNLDSALIPEPEYPEDLTEGHGQGLLLIRKAFDVIRHNEAGNQIMLIKYFVTRALV